MRAALDDTQVMVWRNLSRIKRAPDLLLAFTVQPVMFVLLFRYVFGGAIAVPPGLDYADFLMPGIIVQSMAFGGFVTAMGLSEDLRKGIIDRFRSLPMSPAAVLAGRTTSDILTNTLSLAIMVIVGLVVGFTFDANALEILAGFGILLLFGYAFSWMFAYVGLIASSPEASQSIGFIAIFPLTFASSSFVPVETMPSGLEEFAKANPFSTVTDALRALWLDQPANSDIYMAVIWSAGFAIVFSFLAVRAYRKAVTK